MYYRQITREEGTRLRSAARQAGRSGPLRVTWAGPRARLPASSAGTRVVTEPTGRFSRNAKLRTAGTWATADGGLPRRIVS